MQMIGLDAVMEAQHKDGFNLRVKCSNGFDGLNDGTVMLHNLTLVDFDNTGKCELTGRLGTMNLLVIVTALYSVKFGMSYAYLNAVNARCYVNAEQVNDAINNATEMAKLDAKMEYDLLVEQLHPKADSATVRRMNELALCIGKMRLDFDKRITDPVTRHMIEDLIGTVAQQGRIEGKYNLPHIVAVPLSKVAPSMKGIDLDKDPIVRMMTDLFGMSKERVKEIDAIAQRAAKGEITYEEGIRLVEALK